MAICTISASFLLSGCGGEGDDSSTSAEASSPYIKFDGSANGEGVIDANNTYVKFLKATRTMETFDKLPTDITLDDSNRIVKGGGTVIGAVTLIGGTNNSTIAGLVASNGTMLAVDSSAGGASLKNTNTTFAKPNTGSSSGTGSGSGTSGDLASCAKKPYTGDSSDPQVYSFDAIAQFDQCAYRATRDTKYVTDGNNQCKVLNGLLKSTQSSFRPRYCSGDFLIK